MTDRSSPILFCDIGLQRSAKAIFLTIKASAQAGAFLLVTAIVPPQLGRGIYWGRPSVQNILNPAHGTSLKN
ncbi:hypothetical protein EDS67_20695 [candidate division KSB1 bacterium]|nr:MAG: hypothetical protein EDS67_20695 [candidate division KSB1 bacterium]MBC6949584.1 hypothetical protein [candidate division KSB1 bacterium]MCE7943801.1 hypothetical protein [Chlorobi bacterium CHB1]